jgi:acyl-CoA synthetase (AMP-forming)/AMP-acid ligase II
VKEKVLVCPSPTVRFAWPEAVGFPPPAAAEATKAPSAVIAHSKTDHSRNVVLLTPQPLSARASVQDPRRPYPVAETNVNVRDACHPPRAAAIRTSERAPRRPLRWATRRTSSRADAIAALIDHEGWLHTGDLGHVDRDGNVFVVDRLKELIKVNGLQVAPAELEALLATHPWVADAAVVPAPDPDRGEIPIAVVVPRGQLDPDELVTWTAERVAAHNRIRDVRLVDAIPRTPAGKILRRLLMDHDRRPAPRPAHNALACDTVR